MIAHYAVCETAYGKLYPLFDNKNVQKGTRQMNLEQRLKELAPAWDLIKVDKRSDRVIFTVDRAAHSDAFSQRIYLPLHITGLADPPPNRHKWWHRLLNGEQLSIPEALNRACDHAHRVWTRDQEEARALRDVEATFQAAAEVKLIVETL